MSSPGPYGERMRLPSYPPDGPTCPNCARETWVIRGANPFARFDTYYLCPDGEKWKIIGVKGEIVPLEVARALGE